jgi:hypothetical protein
MSEGYFVVSFLLGMATSILPAMMAIRKRSVVWYILSIVAPCLYSLLTLFVLHLIDGRGLDLREIVGSAIFLIGLGWANAWLVERRKY